MMQKFYFTYGSEGQPFTGGWTEVNAPDRLRACAAFKAFHPCKTEGILNCSGVYNEGDFRQTKMFESGNLGACCHEVITLSVEAKS